MILDLYTSPTFGIAKIMSLSLKKVISFIKMQWSITHPRPTKYPPTSSMNIIGQVFPQTLVVMRDTCMVRRLSDSIQGLSDGLQHNDIGNLPIQCVSINIIIITTHHGISRTTCTFFEIFMAIVLVAKEAPRRVGGEEVVRVVTCTVVLWTRIGRAGRAWCVGFLVVAPATFRATTTSTPTRIRFRWTVRFTPFDMIGHGSGVGLRRWPPPLWVRQKHRDKSLTHLGGIGLIGFPSWGGIHHPRVVELLLGLHDDGSGNFRIFSAN